jgi:hypothetical protein
MVRTLFVSTCVLAFASSVGLAAFSAQARLACSDSSGLCVDGDGSWAPDARTTDKERGKQSKSNGGTLSLEIDGGRGSLFLNGRYAGTAPLDSVDVPSGKSDVQVRDGAEVLATGVLTVSAGASLSITVNHD